MKTFKSDTLNPDIFSMEIRRGTHDLNDVLAAAIESRSPEIESTHFLMAAAGIRDGLMEQFLARLGITVNQWRDGLRECVHEDPDQLPPAHLSRDVFHSSALALLEQAEKLCAQYSRKTIDEPILLLGALGALTPEVHNLFGSVDIDIDQWRGQLELLLMPVEPVRVFAGEEPFALEIDLFSPGAKKILHLMQGEAEALGYDNIDPRHLAMGLLTHKGGLCQLGLLQQGIQPRKIQELLSLNLRGRAKQERSSLALDKDHLQPMLQAIFQRAGELAGRDHGEQVSEAHLLLAFLATPSMALRIMEDEQVDLEQLHTMARQHDPEEEEEEEREVADIDSVRRRLRDRLVGQDDAIERILPFVQRMRFGFTMPDRPVGVFFFCGQSGSGKTEMAKELARAVYGSEENLIFLEMGQFNSAESMNIFVGSPPGYIGYGEGKLTNGLRDHPRSVVLFDEVEKADPKVLDALLRFLDEGRISDPAGPVRDGSQCLIILTSNIGAEALSQLAANQNTLSRAVIRNRLREEMKKEKFRVEFLNRVDELILFNTLDRDEYTAITERLLAKTLDRLSREKEVSVEVEPEVSRAIGAYCHTLDEGARAAARLIQSVVITPVIDYVLRNGCSLPVRVRVRCETNEQNASPDNCQDAADEPRGVVEEL